MFAFVDECAESCVLVAVSCAYNTERRQLAKQGTSEVDVRTSRTYIYILIRVDDTLYYTIVQVQQCFFNSFSSLFSFSYEAS